MKQMKKQEINTWMTKENRAALGMSRVTEYVTRNIFDIVIKRDSRSIDDRKRYFGKAKVGGITIIVWNDILFNYCWEIDIEETKKDQK